MADQKISELTTLATTATGDLIPLVDVDASETKHVTRANLFGQDLTDSDSPTFADLTLSDPTPRIRLSDTDGTNTYGEIQQVSGGLYLTARDGTNIGPVVFRGYSGTSLVEYGRFTSQGYFGIGTSSPAFELDVTGKMRATGGIRPGAVAGEDNYIGRGDTYDFGTPTNVNTSDLLITGGLSGNIVLASKGNNNQEGVIFGAVSTGASPVFTEQMRLDVTSGNVGIGTSIPASNLHVESSGVTNAQLTSTGSNANFLIQAADGFVSRLWFGDASDFDVGSIQYLHTGDAMTFTVNASERMRIDSSGNLLIGTTSTGASILRIVGLPTSSAGLSSGDVWNDSGTLKIV